MFFVAFFFVLFFLFYHAFSLLSIGLITRVQDNPRPYLSPFQPNAAKGLTLRVDCFFEAGQGLQGVPLPFLFLSGTMDYVSVVKSGFTVF